MKNKLIIISSLIVFAIISWNCCSKKATASTNTSSATVYRAKLEIKALCLNYTLRVIEGSIDTSTIATSWTDPTTGKTFQNVFALANPCDFPESIQQGEEFSFKIDTGQSKKCAVCMAYYPVPPKRLIIKVLGK